MKGRTSVAFSAYAKLNFKIILVGHQSPGKTSLILRYVKQKFVPSHGNTQAIEFYSSTVSIKEQEIALQIWDTVGSEHFKNVMKSFYQQASCVLITYCNPAEVKNIVESYLLEVNQYAQEAVKLVIARTKIDEVPVTEEERNFLDDLLKREERVLLWRGVSSKTGEGVDGLFQTIARDLLVKYHKEPAFKELVDPKKDSFLLESRIQQDGRSSRACCKG